MTRPFYIVDVFSRRPYAGNQLAVVMNADGMSGETMLRVAAEINYSETTFVASHSTQDGAFNVRIFTPARELAFAGHPLLGTAWAIRHHRTLQDDSTIKLNIPAGQIPVTFEAASEGGEIGWFVAPPVSLGPICSPSLFASALGISVADIDTTSPIQKLSAGTAAVIVPICSLKALQQCRLDLHTMAPVVAQGLPPLVYLFCRETYDPENDLCARFFFEAHGMREDPASGNAAAFLGRYFLEHRVLLSTDLHLRIEQGYAVNRPSLVYLHASALDKAHVIKVGGHVAPVVRGELL